MEREAESATFRQRFAPARLLGREIDDVYSTAGVQRPRTALFEPSTLAHEFDKELKMIAARRDGELMNETLEDPAEHVRPRRAPGMAGNAEIEIRLREPVIVEV